MASHGLRLAILQVMREISTGTELDLCVFSLNGASRNLFSLFYSYFVFGFFFFV